MREDKGSNNLIIVGNGFDVNHGYPSSYSHFKEWLKKKDTCLYAFLERYIDSSGEWWNEFERHLSDFNIPLLINDTPLPTRPVDPMLPPSFSHPASWRLDSIRDKIISRFSEWVKTLDGTPVEKKLDMPKGYLYVSFNYTSTLERVYEIKEDCIIYIHGKASRGDKLIFGHGKDQYLLEHDVMQKYNLYQSNDFYTAGTYGNSERELTQHISYWEKCPYDQLIKYGKVLLPAVKNTNMVWTYGLSFSEVDFPYIKWIVMNNPNLVWKVSWHTEADKTRICNSFRVLDVTDYELFYM